MLTSLLSHSFVGSVRRLPDVAAISRLLHASACVSGDVLVPHMGDSISEGTISSILKQQGESVRVDDIIAQIETDKVCTCPGLWVLGVGKRTVQTGLWKNPAWSE